MNFALYSCYSWQAIHGNSLGQSWAHISSAYPDVLIRPGCATGPCGIGLFSVCMHTVVVCVSFLHTSDSGPYAMPKVACKRQATQPTSTPSTVTCCCHSVTCTGPWLLKGRDWGGRAGLNFCNSIKVILTFSKLPVTVCLYAHKCKCVLRVRGVCFAVPVRFQVYIHEFFRWEFVYTCMN